MSVPEYVLSCESTVDLTAETLAELDVEYIPFHFFVDGREYSDDLGKTMPFAEFYQSMRDGAETKTAALGVGEYESYFRPFLEAGRDVLHVSLSSGLSGTYDSARTAAAALAAEYPDRRIHVVDSLGASSGYGLIMATLSDKRAQGVGVDELARWITAHRLEMHHEFFSTDLTFYVKGGRVTPTAGFVGNLLNICPLLDMDAEGHLIPREKIRSKRKVIKRVVEKSLGYAAGGAGYTGRFFISESDCIEDAQAVASLLEETFPKMQGKPLISSIGTTIGSHTGPGTVAVFFWGSRRH